MELLDTSLPDLKLVRLDVLRDERGAFAETYDSSKFNAMGIREQFVHDSWSLSRATGTVRGLHFQVPPRAQHKLVRVTRGRILDVIVDIRRGSPTFGKHVAAVISAENWRQIFIPVGFAHGFVTLEPNTEVIYKVSGYYSPKDERGILWRDPALGIAWGIDPASAILSEKDAKYPLLSESKDLF